MNWFKSDKVARALAFSVCISALALGCALIIAAAPALTFVSTTADGFYLVLRSAANAKSLEPISENEHLIKNDFHLLEPAEREAPVYLVLRTDNFIPMTMGAPPVEDTEKATGKPRLSLQLAQNQIAPLVDFTRQNMGKTVAIVIGGDVVTTHKIKSVIHNGAFQITRCTQNGCSTLYSKLLNQKD